MSVFHIEWAFDARNWFKIFQKYASEKGLPIPRPIKVDVNEKAKIETEIEKIKDEITELIQTLQKTRHNLKREIMIRIWLEKPYFIDIWYEEGLEKYFFVLYHENKPNNQIGRIIFHEIPSVTYADESIQYKKEILKIIENS